MSIKRKNTNQKPVLFVAAIMTMSLTTSAQEVWYGSGPAWEAATSNSTVCNFDSLSDGELVDMQCPGITFDSTDPMERHVVNEGEEVVDFSPPNTMRITDSTTGGGNFTATFDTPVAGVGFQIWDLNCVIASGSVANLQLSGGGKVQKNICEIHPFSSEQEWLFIGVSSIEGIDSFEIIMETPDFVAFDDFATADNPIPVASTWGVAIMALLILGIGTLVFERRVAAA